MTKSTQVESMEDQNDGERQDSHAEKAALTDAEELPPPQSAKFWFLFTWGNLFSIVWLGPIIYILYLNFSKYVIGPSISCQVRNCNSHAFAPDAFKRALELDKWDHDILAALQFVAKGLEILFVWIAAAIIYELMIIFGQSKGGLPIGFFLTHLEFSDISSILNPLLWTSPRARHDNRKPATWKLLLFSAFAAILSILASLMGPATAILVLPRLSWVEIPHIKAHIFNSSGFGSGPEGDSVLQDCSASSLAAGKFSCTNATYSGSLTQLLAAPLQYASTRSSEDALNPPIAQQGSINFVVNATTHTTDDIAVPSRQILEVISKDYSNLVNTNSTLYDPPEATPNRSLDFNFQRDGPSIGLSVVCGLGNFTKTSIARDKNVFCVSDWAIYNRRSRMVETYTQCFKNGNGFGRNNKVSTFSMNNQTRVDIFTSESATYFNNTTDFGSGIEACLDESQAPNCDWDRIFSTEVPEEIKRYSSNNLMTVYSIINNSIALNESLENSTVVSYCSHFFGLAMSTYGLDVSQANNPANIARLSSITKPAKGSIFIDPAWVLAAWSVDQYGNRDSPSGEVFSRLLPGLLKSTTLYFADDLNALLSISLFSIVQVSSIIPLNLTDIPANASDSTGNDTILYKWISRYVWAYGDDTRSSQFALTVTIAGVVCVPIQIILSYLKARKSHEAIRSSATDILVAAMKHKYDQELEVEEKPVRRVKKWLSVGKEKEIEMARTRYRIRRAGKETEEVKLIPIQL